MKHALSHLGWTFLVVPGLYLLGYFGKTFLIPEVDWHLDVFIAGMIVWLLGSLIGLVLWKRQALASRWLLIASLGYFLFTLFPIVTFVSFGHD